MLNLVGFRTRVGVFRLFRVQEESADARTR